MGRKRLVPRPMPQFHWQGGGKQLQINIWHIQSCKALWGLSNERYDEELHLGAPACICALLRQIDALPSHSIVSLPLGFSADATSRQQYLANLIFFLSFFWVWGGGERKTCAPADLRGVPLWCSFLRRPGTKQYQNLTAPECFSNKSTVQYLLESLVFEKDQ